MKGKTNIKIILDIVLTVLFLILIDPQNTGFAFHEIAGLTIEALFIFHITLNWSWVKSVTKNLFNDKLKTRPKLYYLLNAISFICVATIIITGVEISHVLFASNATSINHNYVTVHKWVSYSCLALFAVHMLLHWRFIINALRRIFAPVLRTNFLKPVMGLGAVVLTISLLYSGIVSNASEDADRVRGRKESHGQRGGVYQQGAIDSGKEDPGQVNSFTPSPGSTTQTQDNSILGTADNAGESVTMAEFLAKMFCNGCEKHCCLASLQCDRGTAQLEAAKTQYQQLYKVTV